MKLIFIGSSIAIVYTIRYDPVRFLYGPCQIDRHSVPHLRG